MNHYLYFQGFKLLFKNRMENNELLDITPRISLSSQLREGCITQTQRSIAVLSRTMSTSNYIQAELSFRTCLA